LQLAVADALAYLMTVHRDGLAPEEAQGRLRLLRGPHADTRMQLLWDQQAYDGSVHYDLLLEPKGGGGTVSLSWCPDSAVPWPLRGVHRWSDAELLRVNSVVLRVEDAVTFLDCVWREAPLRTRMIDVCLIREELAREPIEIGDEELQQAMDDFRRERGLATAEITQRWLQAQGLTHERFEELVLEERLLARLRARIAAGRVESAFAARRGQLEVARVARLDGAGEAEARALHRRIAGGEVDLLAAAAERFAAGGGAAPSLFATLRRCDAAQDPLAAAVFAAAPGDLVGPVRVGAEWTLARVLSVTPAELDAPTRARVEELLFEEWLAERRRTAIIDWNWGQRE
jgi:putative peptide maturation system protein